MASEGLGTQNDLVPGAEPWWSGMDMEGGRGSPCAAAPKLSGGQVWLNRKGKESARQCGAVDAASCELTNSSLEIFYFHCMENNIPNQIY